MLKYIVILHRNRAGYSVKTTYAMSSSLLTDNTHVHVVYLCIAVWK